MLCQPDVLSGLSREGKIRCKVWRFSAIFELSSERRAAVA